MTEGNEVLWVEPERGTERLARVRELSGLKERLPKHDLPIHVVRLFGQMFLAEENRAIEEAGLAVLVGQRRKKAPRVLVVPFPQVVDAGVFSHQGRPVGGERARPSVNCEDTTPCDVASIRSVRLA